MSEYQILSLEEDTMTINVMFDGGIHARIDIPVNDGVALSGEELGKYIAGLTPTYDLNRLNAIKSGVLNIDEIRAIVPKQLIKMESLSSQMAKREGYLKSMLRSEIAVNYKTSVENLQNYEAKIARLSFVAVDALANPSKYFGVTFNGNALPNNVEGVVAVMREFLDFVTAAHEHIELAVQRYGKLMDELINCDTPEEIEAVSW